MSNTCLRGNLSEFLLADREFGAMMNVALTNEVCSVFFRLASFMLSLTHNHRAL